MSDYRDPMTDPQASARERPDYAALIARLSALSGPDREVDRLVCPFKTMPNPHYPNEWVYWVEGKNYGPQWEDIPHYTGPGIDAAMGLTDDPFGILRSALDDIGRLCLEMTAEQKRSYLARQVLIAILRARAQDTTT